MRIPTFTILLLAAACAPPTENASEPENQSAPANIAEAGDREATPASARATPPPDDASAPKAAPAPKADEPPYTARGQEPGWLLRIDKGRIDYQGNYGEKKIETAAPEPQPIANGRRYVTDRLTATITYERCNDAMSGHGYEHKVKVVADGESYDGCGGARRTDWDM